MVKRWDFRDDLKVSRVGAFRIFGGRENQRVGAAAMKALSPKLFSLV